MSLYEYKHPIINKDLASTDERKSFPTLESWYDVVNDYEFQARCPIILKNSHRSKHFTFACHLKSCPFKVLLSYSGGSGSQASHGDTGGPISPNGGSMERDKDVSETGVEDEKKVNVEDDVSAAIAAAVAAVANTGSQHNENSMKGPFTVTKIEPYHNHPLETNLSLFKFVLTKIPKILQNDLKFDSILETLCNEDDNTVAKFRVSQYVDESGILEIIKERYGLTDQELDKKLLAQIARRITTYKARFVLKRKKQGPYAMSSSHDMTGNDEDDVDVQVPEHVRHHVHHHVHANVDAAAVAAAAAMSVDGGKHGLDAMDEQPKKKMRSNKISNAVKMGTRGSLVADHHQQDTVNGDVADQDVDIDSDMHHHHHHHHQHKEMSPHDEMAEQLRLLSSHLKEVEAQEHGNVDVDPEIKKDDDIADENIQPELRGQ
ncbi:HBL049Wp [Eremothecium sinecaudum]|uniref:HBL049Wp n=1 Tax=Eremothecium sinecaudum TaxID=45286 RepID=A0A109UWI7_9SACH|nr:HBL049Wp [Eremothecium sinecaudum]AMD18853.1 HBL049Wp [Eremothecium sinecaudum]